MRFFQFKSILAFFVIGLIFACCSSSTEDAVDDNAAEFMTASIETIPFAASVTPAGVSAVKIENETKTLIIQGVSDDGSTIGLVINDYEGSRVYNLGFTTDSRSNDAVYSNQFGKWSSQGGALGLGDVKINVINNGTEITGTFRFVGYEARNSGSSRTVINGEFRAKFN